MSNDPVLTFVQQLRQSQLLDAAQLDEVERLRATATRPGQLASELVRRGWLTPHQANQVAMGRGAGLILGSYLVLEPIGSGGMGQVVKARHRFMQRNVALKLIRQDQRDSADILERFQRETRLLAELRHSHIVHAYDAGLAGDVWFLAMELLEGIDLAGFVQQRGRLPVGLACEYIRQATLGLQHAHQRGLVHRDIKPSNLFLTAEGVKLLDLGLARPQASGVPGGELTQNNSVMGTPDYLAPEQAVDPRKAGTRSDIYSLGCTLYFLLTGQPPFPEGTLTQKLLAHQQMEATPIERVRPETPPALAILLRRMLAKRPEDRPANAAEVAAQLAPLSTPENASAIPRPVPASIERGRSLLHDPTVAAQKPPSLLPQPQTAAPISSSLLQSETVLPMAQAPTLVSGQGTTPTRQRAVLENDTVLTSVSQPSTSTPGPFGLPRQWLWRGAAGAGALLVLILALVLWPKKESNPVEKGSVGSGATDRSGVAEPRWTADRTVKLPGAAVRVATGGGGRYFVLHLKEQRKLVVFDVLRGESLHELPGDDTILFAAGAKQVVVIEPVNEKIRLYGLDDGKEQRAVQMPPALVGKPIQEICMGSASEGPVYIYLPYPHKRTLMLDLAEMTTTDVNWRDFGPQNAYGPNNMRTTPDGKMLLGYGGGWGGLGKVTFEKGKQVGPYDRLAFGAGTFALPSADGNWVFTPEGVYSRNLILVPVPHVPIAYFVPAREPGYYLTLLPGSRSLVETIDGRQRWEPVHDPIVYSEDRQRLFVIEKCKELHVRSMLRFEERIHYYPRAGMFVLLSADGGQVILRRVPLPTN